MLSWGGVVEVEIQRVGAAVADDGHLLHEDRANGGGVEEQLPKSPLDRHRGPAAPGPTQPHHHVLGGGSP